MILLIGYSIYIPSRAIGGVLPSIGKVDKMFKISYLSAFMNILLNMILIPIFGIVGASSATPISLIFMAGMRYHLIIKYVFKERD